MTIQIIDDAHEKYVKDIEKASKDLYPILLGIVQKYSKNGKLSASPAELAGLDTEITQALSNSVSLLICCPFCFLISLFLTQDFFFQSQKNF